MSYKSHAERSFERGRGREGRGTEERFSPLPAADRPLAEERDLLHLVAAIVQRAISLELAVG